MSSSTEKQLNAEDSDKATEYLATKTKYVEPPDGGYGWVIVIACLFGHLLIMIKLTVPGMIFVHIKEEFGVSYANLNILFSLSDGAYFLASPLASIFGNRYGSRLMIATGGILQGFGTTLSAFSPSIIFIHILLGMLTGIGTAFLYSPLAVEIAKYFKKRRSLALAISQIGISAGSIIAPILLQYLIDTYNWRGALVITGAIYLHLIVIGAMLRPINIKPDDERNPKGRKKLLDVGLFKSKKFVLFELTESLTQPAHNFFLFYVVAYASTEQGYSEYHAVVLLSVSAFVGLAARPIIGVVSLVFKIDCFAFLAVVIGVMASNYAIYPFLTSYWASLILVGIYGFCKSAQSLLSVNGLSIIAGPNKLMSAFGLRGIFLTPSSLLLPPFAGWLSDTYGTLRATFWLSFALLSLTCLLTFVYYLLFSKKTFKNGTITEEGE